jgi:hypothetical protein
MMEEARRCVYHGEVKLGTKIKHGRGCRIFLNTGGEGYNDAGTIIDNY